jgi:hypothetical protein
MRKLMEFPSHVTAQKLKVDENGDLYISEIVEDGNPPKTKRVELLELDIPLAKVVECNVIIRRDFYDPFGSPKIFLGLQRLQLKIPVGEDFRYWFLCYREKKMSTICLSIVDIDTLNRTTQTLDFNSKFGERITRKIGKPKVLTEQEARVLIRTKAVLGVFNDNLSETRV